MKTHEDDMMIGSQTFGHSGFVEALRRNKDSFIIQLLVCKSALNTMQIDEMQSSIMGHSKCVHTTLFEEFD